MPVVAMALTRVHVCALQLGDTYAWGWNDYGQLGLGTRDSQPQPTILERMRNKKVGPAHPATPMTTPVAIPAAALRGSLALWLPDGMARHVYT